MAIYKINEIIAILNGEGIYCPDCASPDDLGENEVTIYEENDRNDYEVLQCDQCSRII